MHADLGLGNLITTKQQRDAIHIAVAPVVAAERLKPGQHVGLFDGKASLEGEPCGIVDPFLVIDVRRGETFWLFLYPNTVTGLRHDWTHPAFRSTQPNTEASEAWLREFAAKAGRDYEALLEIGQEVAATQRGVHVGDDDDSDLFNEHKQELLRHLSIVLGLPMPDDVYFSCAC